MIDTKILALSLAMRSAHRADLFIYNVVGEKEYQDSWTRTSWATVLQLRDALFKAITGYENSFDVFYDTFSGPGHNPDKKPVAWIESKGYIPDVINDVLLDNKITTMVKVRRVRQLYNRCRKALEKR